MANPIGRILAMSRWPRFGVLVTLGVFAALGQAPLDVWPATIAGVMVVLLLHQQATTPKQAAYFTWAFGFGYFGFALRWIVEPFLVDIARHGWMAPFALFLMAAGAGLFWGFAAYVAKRFSPRSGLMLGIGLIWLEVARSLILTGFPWALIGHSLISTPLAQLAAFGGPHILTLCVVLIAWVFSISAQLPRRGPSAGLALGCVLSVLGAFWGLRVDAPAKVDADAPIVRLVQPNAPQHQKWDPAYRDIFVRRLLDYSRQGDIPDLIVWPETSVPSLLNYIEPDMTAFVDAARGAPLILGIQRQGDDGEYYNSFVVMQADGQISDVYDKSHLVPFGEYMPGGGLARRVGLTGLADTMGSGFTAGAGAVTVDVPGIGPAIPLICYEGIFAEEIGHTGERPRLMILITNDAWFGKAVGPIQHLAQARLRAIEQGLPMVRAANTGVAAVIDARGQIIDQIPLGTDGFIDVPLPAALSPTSYAHYGDAPLLALLIILTFGYYLQLARKRD